jgi:hypothetical protein
MGNHLPREAWINEIASLGIVGFMTIATLLPISLQVINLTIPPLGMVVHLFPQSLSRIVVNVRVFYFQDFHPPLLDILLYRSLQVGPFIESSTDASQMPVSYATSPPLGSSHLRTPLGCSLPYPVRSVITRTYTLKCNINTEPTHNWQPDGHIILLLQHCCGLCLQYRYLPLHVSGLRHHDSYT